MTIEEFEQSKGGGECSDIQKGDHNMSTAGDKSSTLASLLGYKQEHKNAIRFSKSLLKLYNTMSTNEIVMRKQE